MPYGIPYGKSLEPLLKTITNYRTRLHTKITLFVQHPRWKCDFGGSLADDEVIDSSIDHEGNSISPTSGKSD